MLEREGFVERLGADHIHGNIHRAVEAHDPAPDDHDADDPAAAAPE